MAPSEVFNVIVNHTKEVLPDLENHAFNADDSLRELGANSIDRSEIIMMTMESLSIRIPMIELAAAQNIGDLAAILASRTTEATS